MTQRFDWTSRVLFSQENVSQDCHVQQSEKRNTSIAIYMSPERMVTKDSVAQKVNNAIRWINH